MRPTLTATAKIAQPTSVLLGSVTFPNSVRSSTATPGIASMQMLFQMLTATVPRLKSSTSTP